MRRARDWSPVLGGHTGDMCHEGGVRWRQSIAIEADIVLEPGSTMPAKLQRPARDLELMPSYRKQSLVFGA